MPSSLRSPLAPALSDGALIRRLLAFGWGYRGQCICLLSLRIILVLLELGIISLIGLAIDFIWFRADGARVPHWPFGLTPPGHWSPMETLGLIAGLILLQAVLCGVINYFYNTGVARLIHRDIVASLRSLVYEKLQRLSFRFFDANASGTIINRVTSDVQATRMFVDGVIIQGAILVLTPLIDVLYLLSIHVRLTVACLMTAPIIWLASFLFSRWVQPAYARSRELADRMVLILSESIQGIHTIKGFAREGDELAKFRNANDAATRQQRDIFWRVSLFHPSITLLTDINMAVLLGYGGMLVLRGELHLGTGLIVFVGLMQAVSGQIAGIAGITNTIQQSLTGARRVFEILDAPIEIQSPPNAKHLPKIRGAVRFDHVWFEFKETETVLQDVDFEAQPGQCVAILGATGAGKSALMSLIPRFYDPRRGRVMLDGADVRDLNLDGLRRNIGLVFQESFLFSNTVAANIVFGHPGASREQIERAARMAAAHEFITHLPQGYNTMLGEGGVNLSGGQRQRLALARALLLEPAVLLLDDPTAAVDAQTEHEIFEAMDIAIAGRTTFVVAHRLSTLRRADMILVLDEGRIVQRGTHEELMNIKGPYRKVAMLQLADAESTSILSEGQKDKTTS
ncbi:MAG: ABC transporter ATP-binding protein [Verrucomicrobia bacterium]|nr:ABC transporter ATP-binding protein [Verrucomicrobiota bacterium]